jgi:inosine-uridine nucleoside N-ribohydrolase
MTRIHIDTDLGGDIDDLCALAMVLAWPDVELVGVTTVAEHQGQRAGYVRYVLELAGRGDIPVAAGADVSLGCYRIWQGLQDHSSYWPKPIPPAPTPLDAALALLERSIERGVTIVAIGPYTNLALLERRSPGILRGAKLFLMGGYVFAPRNGFPQWGPEDDFNAQVDVQSAFEVITHSRPTFVPLAVTAETALRRADLSALRRSGSLAKLIARQAEAYAREYDFETVYGRTCDGVPGDMINFQHDALTCAIALRWRDGVEISEIPLRLEIKGGWLRHTIDAGGVPTRVVTRVDGERLNAFWLETVTR